MDTLLRNNPGNGLLPAVVALAAAAAIVSITIARQQVVVDRAAAAGALSPAAESAVDPRPAASPHPMRTRAVPPAPSFSRDGDVIRILAKDMPRTVAAAQLAKLTRARIVAGAQWLALAPDLDLEWQGSDAADAWKRVLGNGVRHTVTCNGDGCSVRILSVDVDGGSVTVPEPAQASRAGAPAETPGLMNRPTDPDAIDESALAP